MSAPQITPIPPEKAEKDTLPGLPKELLEAIAEEADPSDILTLRQTSRDILDAVDRVFVRKYFTDRNHLLTVESLKDLIDITATSRLCKPLGKLTLSMPWLNSRYYEDRTRKACSPPCTNEAHSGNDQEGPNCVVWAAWLQARKSLTDSMRGLLEQALCNIASVQGAHCLYLRLEGGFMVESHGHGKASFERYLTVPMYIPSHSHGEAPLMNQYSRESTSNLLHAVAASGVVLRELHLPKDFFFIHDDQRKELVPNWKPEWFPYLQQHGISRSFSKVHTIGLGDHAHRWLPPLSSPGFQDIVTAWFPALTSLSVPSYVDMRRLIATFPPGKFKKIHIERTYYVVYYDQVAALLAHHRSSLNHLSLTKFSWRYNHERSRGEVQDLLQWVVDNLELHTFEFQGNKWDGNGSEIIEFEWHGDMEAELCELFESGIPTTKPPGDEPEAD